jgi:hypothetical protein
LACERSNQANGVRTVAVTEGKQARALCTRKSFQETQLKAEARIETDQAPKYLKWLCGHFKIKVPAEYDAAHGSIQFTFGTCEMNASANELVMRVEAPDAEAFATVKEVVGGHLERFAHKDAVQVTWVDVT